MESILRQQYRSELASNLERVCIAQQILTMTLARTIEFHMNWSYGNSYNMLTTNSFNSRPTNSGGLSKQQRYRRNKKLKRLQKEQMPHSAAKATMASKSNMAATKHVPSKSSTAISKIIAPPKPATATSSVTTKEAESTISTCTTAATKSEKQKQKSSASLDNVPDLSGMLEELATKFRTQINALQKVFDAELKNDSHAARDNQPIVAEITFKNICPIPAKAFQLIHSRIQDSIEKLQKSEEANIPIFYCMANKCTYIHILCQDQYAYEFLEECLECTKKISIYPLKASTVRLFCFSAIYKSIVDVEQFLLQIRSHLPKMHTDHWIVANSKVIRETGRIETQFLFLVDELSALMLEHQYGNRLVINLSEVLFHNHGQLPNLV